MSELERIIHDLRVRIDALERAIPSLRDAAPASGDDERGDSHLSGGAAHTQLSRRRLLRQTAQAAAATAVAGALLHNGVNDASAEHSSNSVDANVVHAHRVFAQELKITGEEGAAGIVVTTTNGASAASIYNDGTGTGLRADSKGEGPGVIGMAIAEDVAGWGVIGVGAYGVAGQSYTTEPGYHGVWGLSVANGGHGVFGEGKDGATGVLGEGRIAIHGKSTATSGYAGVFEGGKAQLRIVPGNTAGQPTSGYHQKGELYLDRNANLWLCTAAGSPGTWKRVAVV
jgi:hypothetical protein